MHPPETKAHPRVRTGAGIVSLSMATLTPPSIVSTTSILTPGIKPSLLNRLRVSRSWVPTLLSPGRRPAGIRREFDLIAELAGSADRRRGSGLRGDRGSGVPGLGDPSLEALRDHVLEPLGLVVNLFPAIAQHLSRERSRAAGDDEASPAQPVRPSSVSLTPR